MIYFRLLPNPRTASFTSGVKATGEKTASAPEVNLTVMICQYWKVQVTFKDLPSVALPPNLIVPNRLNGRLKVFTLGVTSLMTMTSEGFAGTSLEVMMLVRNYEVCGGVFKILDGRKRIWCSSVWRFRPIEPTKNRGSLLVSSLNLGKSKDPVWHSRFLN